MAVELAELLVKAVESFDSAEHLETTMKLAHEIEHKGDMLNHTVYENVAIDFITPIDREDIIALTQRLDDISDYIEDVMRSFYMYDVHSMHDGAKKFADLIYSSCVALDKAFGNVKDFRKTQDYKTFVVEVNDLEEEGDQLYIQVMRDLHTKDRERAMYVHVWSQIFDRMEKCCDACEHVADYLATVALKNS